MHVFTEQQNGLHWSKNGTFVHAVTEPLRKSGKELSNFLLPCDVIQSVLWVHRRPGGSVISKSNKTIHCYANPIK